LRTVEDVFLYAWGTDQLTYRAGDLDQIRRWTARDADWQELLRIHHAIRPKPKGKPTYWLVTQMEGEHGYLRRDVRKALAQGLLGVFPDSWKPQEESASIEVWLSVQEATAVCGLRLSDRTMRHRTYKLEHRPASLRPTVAAAMVRLAGIKTGHIVLDPMCGVGTILAEHLVARKGLRGDQGSAWGGDIEFGAIRSASLNLRRLGSAALACWDATLLPLPSSCVDRVISNAPFGKKLSSLYEIGPLYQAMVQQYNRVLVPGGMAVLLAAGGPALSQAAQRVDWRSLRQLRLRLLGQPAMISVWQKLA
jgi:tRNA (guanine6-N2)-methyltransferase